MLNSVNVNHSSRNVVARLCISIGKGVLYTHGVEVGSQLGSCEGRCLTHKKEHTSKLLTRKYIGIIFYGFENRGSVMGVFLISLHSSFMMILSRSYKQKRGTVIVLRKRAEV